MENRFMQRVSGFIPASFTSCQYRNVSDVIDSTIVISRDHFNQNSVPTSSNSLIKRPHRNNNYNKPVVTISKSSPIFFTHQVTKPKSRLFNSDTEKRRNVPTTPPISRLKENKERSTIKNASSSSNGGWFSSEEGGGGGGGEGEARVGGETDTFFSLSSGASSESFRRKICNLVENSSETSRKTILPIRQTDEDHRKITTTRRVATNISERFTGNSRKTAENHHSKTTKTCGETTEFQAAEKSDDWEASANLSELYYKEQNISRRKTGKRRRRRSRSRRREMDGSSLKTGRCSIVVEGRVEESYAVTKSSSDPYGDFRESMVEMIMEKQIFGSEDLKRLLHCFLSLNSPGSHNLIVQVFSDICQALFTLH